MLNEKTGNRLKREFIDSETEKVVEREQQVKGFETGSDWDGGTIIDKMISASSIVVMSMSLMPAAMDRYRVAAERP
jgi:hypothetical protein